MNKEDLKYLKRIDKKVSKDVKEIFDELNEVPCPSFENIKREMHLEPGEDLAQLSNGNYMLIKMDYLPEEKDY